MLDSTGSLSLEDLARMGPTLAPVLLAVLLAVLGLRVVVIQMALRRRVAAMLIPTDRHNFASLESRRGYVEFLERTMAQVRQRRRNWWTRPAGAVRFRLDSIGGRGSVLVLEGPHWARGVVSTSYTAGLVMPKPGIVPRHRLTPKGLFVVPEDGDDVPWTSGRPDGPPPERLYTERAELTLVHDDLRPLAEWGVRPDPMWRIVRVLIKLDAALGESGSVTLDLLPLTPRERRRYRRKLAGKARRSRDFGGSGWLDDIDGLGGAGGARDLLVGQRGVLAEMLGAGDGRQSPQKEDLETGRTVEELTERLKRLGTAFRVQVLVSMTSPDRDKAKLCLEAMVSAFGQFAARNAFEVHGFNLGVAFLSSADIPGLRWFFEHRLRTGLFHPLRKRVVGGGEVAGFLKPAYDGPEPDSFMLHLTGAQIPPEVPDFDYRPELLPLGQVFGSQSLRTLAQRIEDSRLTYLAGHAKSGRTQVAMNQFIHLARSGHGCLFLDPHPANLDRLRPYLTTVADRVVEIDFTGQGPARQLGWNVLSMVGRSAEDVDLKTKAVVEAFASVLHLGLFPEQELTRAYLTMAVQSVLELARVLPAELAPTIFQVGTLLSDEGWRATALPHLGTATRGFWERNFSAPAEELIAPLTSLLERLRAWAPAAAVLGAARSSYDLLDLMDQGKVVLVCTGGFGDAQRLAANLLAYDLLNAALARRRVPPERRRTFHAFLDEVETYDGAGAAYAGRGMGQLGDLLEEVGRYGLNTFLLNQSPDNLTARTRESIFTNRTCLATMAVDNKGAEIFFQEWQTSLTGPLGVTLQDRFHMLAALRVERLVTLPFTLFTVPVSRMWAHCRHDSGVGALNGRIARNSARPSGRRSPEQLLELDGHIRRWLEEHPDGAPEPVGRAGAAAPASYRARAARPKLTVIDGGGGRRGNQ